MKSKVKIFYLPIKRWQEYKAIRLESLTAEPIAFGRDTDEETSTKKEFVKLLKEKRIIFAEFEGKLIGFVGLKQLARRRFKHIAELGPLYVNNVYRRSGFGKKLLEFAFKKAKEKGVEKVSLKVNKSNKPAVLFYKKIGFKVVGRAEKEYKIKEKYYDSLIMEKWI